MSNAYRSVLASGGIAPTGDAVAADVLAGKTFSNANAVGVNGTMVNRGAVSATVSAGQSYTIPEGYHNGNGVVTDNTQLNPASALITKNQNGYGTYTISGTNIKFVYAIFASASFTDGSFGVTSGSLTMRDVLVYTPSSYTYPSSGNAFIASASATEVKVTTQGGGCTNAQFFIVGDDVQITFA